MLMTVTKWGNSLGVRIPSAIAHKVGIQEGTPIDISIQDHHIVLSKKHSLDALLEQVNPENLHHETLTGPISGKESW
jgi:antitoxin MazE